MCTAPPGLPLVALNLKELWSSTGAQVGCLSPVRRAGASENTKAVSFFESSKIC